jgi:hypothetical protein
MTAASGPLNQSSARDGNVVRFEKCGVALSFAGVPRETTRGANVRGEFAADIESTDNFEYENASGTYYEAAVCRCFKSTVPANSTRWQATETITNELKQRDIAVSATSWDEQNPLGKSLHYEASTPHPRGKILIVGRWLYLPRCTFQVFSGSNEKDGFDRGKAFLRTTRAITQLPQTPVSPSSGRTAERLQELQQLRDRNLISPAEFEQKRKAILDAL